MVPSPPAETTVRPSELYCSDETQCSWAGNSRSFFPLARSQNVMWPGDLDSLPRRPVPETRILPLGEKATQLTQSGPSNVRGSLRSAGFHNMISDRCPVAKVFPSLEKPQQVNQAAPMAFTCSSFPVAACHKRTLESALHGSQGVTVRRISKAVHVILMSAKGINHLASLHVPQVNVLTYIRCKQNSTLVGTGESSRCRGRKFVRQPSSA